MAVEAKNLNLFHAQLIQDRQLMNSSNQGNVNSGYTSPGMGFLGLPYDALLPENRSIYQTGACDSVQAKTSINTDSGVTYNFLAPRKRSRDSTNHLYAVPNYPAPEKHSSVSRLPTFAGEDISPQIRQYQLEIDAIISQHTKKIRLEFEERQKQQARLLAAALGEGVMKKLKEKDEQIQRIGKVNLALQERVKNLYYENQLLRDLAQTNEAAANSLRTNLDQVLMHAAAVEEDVESCCGGSDEDAQDKDGGRSRYSDRKCRLCGERESCVLLLPCRHLCLCGVCGSGSHKLQACPVCNSSMSATLHVNIA